MLSYRESCADRLIESDEIGVQGKDGWIRLQDGLGKKIGGLQVGLEVVEYSASYFCVESTKRFEGQLVVGSQNSVKETGRGVSGLQGFRMDDCIQGCLGRHWQLDKTRFVSRLVWAEQSPPRIYLAGVST